MSLYSGRNDHQVPLWDMHLLRNVIVEAFDDVSTTCQIIAFSCFFYFFFIYLFNFI